VGAERWLATAQVALLRGEWVDPALGRTTVGNCALTWTDGLAHLKPSTRARYLNIYEVHIRPRWGEVQLVRITHGEIAAWLAKLLRDGVAASTVRQVYRVLALILDLAVRDGRLPRNPAVGVKLPRADQVEKRFLTHAQVAQLAHACPPPSDLVVLVLAYTGLRWGELAALRKRDLNLLAVDCSGGTTSAAASSTGPLHRSGCRP
jgi:integrase